LRVLGLNIAFGRLEAKLINARDATIKRKRRLPIIRADSKPTSILLSRMVAVPFPGIPVLLSIIVGWAMMADVARWHVTAISRKVDPSETCSMGSFELFCSNNTMCIELPTKKN
jgi:hypothetical protein